MPCVENERATDTSIRVTTFTPVDNVSRCYRYQCECFERAYLRCIFSRFSMFTLVSQSIVAFLINVFFFCFAMAVPNELSLESVRDFMITNGGKVTNHDLVTYFKYFLTNPENRGKSIIIVDTWTTRHI